MTMVWDQNIKTSTSFLSGKSPSTGSVAVEVKTLDSEYPHGEFEAILSKPTTDRDMEIVAAKAFDPLPDHITIDVDHALKTSGVVGSGTPYYDGDMLMVKGRFASTALGQDVRALVAERHIRTMSVAFRGAEKEAKDGVTTITKAELINAAFVAVPANRDALILSSKAGRVLSSRNEDTVRQVITMLSDLLSQMAAEETAEGDTAKTLSEDDDLEQLRLRARLLRLRAQTT